MSRLRPAVRRRISRTADGHHFQQLMRDRVSPRLPEFDRIERENRLLDQIQCDAGDIAGLFAIEGLA